MNDQCIPAITSSNQDEWSTPEHLFDELNKEFFFDLDPCATEENHKCSTWFSKDQDGLMQSWARHTVWCNPPYSNVSAWVKKGFVESKNDNTVVVMLLPARTDTKYFHDFIIHRSEIRFVKGRLKFGNAKNNAPFPSMIVIWRGAFA